MNFNEPLILEDILPANENIEILKHLSNTEWKIQGEGDYDERHNLKLAFLNNAPHVGFAKVVYDIRNKNTITDFNSMLFIWPRIITNIITQRLDINFKKIIRFHWNYYYKDQEGIGHIDDEKDSYLSILYNPHTTDGGTEIKNKFYQDKIGQAKVFKSNWKHRGVACKKDKARTSLNIVLEV